MVATCVRDRAVDRAVASCDVARRTGVASAVRPGNNEGPPVEAGLRPIQPMNERKRYGAANNHPTCQEA